MKVVGRVESLWRYPVKSMRGEELSQAFADFPGVYGDRFYAFLSSAAQKGFPYFTGRQNGRLLQYRPVYRHAARSIEPPNLAEAEALASTVTPLYGNSADLMVDVQTPSGDLIPIDDPLLLELLLEGLPNRPELKLVQSHRAMTDSRPVSLISTQTAQRLSNELGSALDQRRFRANVYLDLESGHGFGENEFVGRKLQIGGKTVVAVTDRDPRCKMITLDPDTAEPNPQLMRLVAHAHDGKAGVYGVVLVEGTIRPSDPVALLD